jgi:hypothetical protein
MYFWNIEKLKTQLIEKPLTDKETLPYLIATITLLIAVRYLPQVAQFNNWDYALLILELACVIVGSYWLYLKNKGDAGSHFLQRYFALGWVVAIRVIVFSIPIVVVIVGIITYMNLGEAFGETTNYLDFLFMLILELVIYWYNGKHLADLAAKAKY